MHEGIMKHRMVATALLLTFVVCALSVGPSGAAMSVIRGSVYWYDQYGNLRPLAWAQVVAAGEDGTVITASSLTDGTYMMWVAPGDYNVSVTMDPGFMPQSYVITVTDGGVAVVDFQLEPTGEPIPEYSSWLVPLLLGLSTLCAAILIRRRQT